MNTRSLFVVLSLGVAGPIGCDVKDLRESSVGAEPAPKTTEASESQPRAAAQRGEGAVDPQGFRGIFVRVAQGVVPSVVSIVSERNVTVPRMPFDFFGNPFEFFFEGPGSRGGRQGMPQRQFRQTGLGSGFMFDNQGHILTNNHVVANATTLKVKLSDDKEYDAEVVGSDPPTDLAVIKLKEKPPPGLVPVRFGNSDQLQIGEWVVAVGAPFGLYESVTTGIISAMERQDTGITAYGNFLQTDAAINPGNSGGPLVNLDGEVVGINTAIYSRTGGYQGVGFAIPINLAKTIAAHLVKEGKVTRGWLGVSIQSISPDMAEALGLDKPTGALVGDIVPGGPAEKAGLERGDVIVSVSGEPVEDASDLMNRIALLAPGSSSELGIVRDGKRKDVKVTVARREDEVAGRPSGPSAPEQPTESARLGLGVTELSTEIRQQLRLSERIKSGVVVAEIDPVGAAAEAGLEPGDVILEVNQKPVATVEDFRKRVRDVPKGRGVLLLVHRGGNSFFAVVRPIPEKP